MTFKGVIINSFIGTVVAIAILVAVLQYNNRPTVVGVVHDDGEISCSFAYDANGPRGCKEVMDGGIYEQVLVPPLSEIRRSIEIKVPNKK